MNNRELAVLIWFVVFLIWVVARRDLRPHLGGLLRAAATPKILVPFVALLGWVTLELWLGWRLDLWTSSLTKDAVIWFATAGAVLFFNLNKVSEQDHFLRRRALKAFGLSAFLEVFTSLFVLNLFVELLLQPLLVLLVMISVVADKDEQSQVVKRLVDRVMVAITLSILVYVVVVAIDTWGELDKVDLARQLALPAWLTVGLVPYIYILGLCAAYGQAFFPINWSANEDHKGPFMSKLALVLHYNVKVRHVAEFGGGWRLSKASGFRDARKIIRDVEAEAGETQRAEEEARDRLVQLAGVEGVDEGGRRLDRREFEETTSALRWLASCMMGWYQREHRYRSDLLEVLGDDFTSNGLPQPSRIEMRVAGDGQSWFAWRRAVTGWCFAIGAAGQPPDQWLYDGPEPPTGFPRQDPVWGTDPFVSGVDINW